MKLAPPDRPASPDPGPRRHAVPGPSVADGETPLSWRIASLGILFGAGLAGRAAGHPRVGRVALAPVVGLAAWGAIHVARANRRVPVARPSARSPLASLPEVTVLVPARDEVEVVTELIGDLARQDHRDQGGAPRFEVVVVDDRSVDGTGRAVERRAEAAGIGSITRVVRREGSLIPDGKGAALACVSPATCRDVIVVLDADARVAPDFLRRAAAHLACGAPALQARRRVLGAGARRSARVQDDEQTLDGAIQRGRWESGGCSEFRGNGMVVRRDVLIDAGGWRAGLLTEDLDLSSRLAATIGGGIPWAHGLEVWESPVERLDDLWVQRLRWAEGSIRRYFEHGPTVLGSRGLTRSARLDFAAYGGQLVAPPFILGLALGAIVDRRVDRLAVALGAYGLAGLVLAYDALGRETAEGGSGLGAGARLPRAAEVTLFGGLWLVVVPAAFWRSATRRGPVRFAKVPHHRVPSRGPFPSTADGPRGGGAGGPTAAGRTPESVGRPNRHFTAECPP